jgi:hypothetical protein
MFAAVGIGLYAPRITYRTWILMAGWILLILLYNYLKAH